MLDFRADSMHVLVMFDALQRTHKPFAELATQKRLPLRMYGVGR